MALIDVTPIMISDTEPTPYIVEYSGNNNKYSPYKVFTKDNSNYLNAWYSPIKQAWLSIFMGEPTLVTHFNMMSYNWDSSSSYPRQFKVYGSNDKIKWDLLGEYMVTEAYKSGAGKMFDIQSPSKYLYYKWDVLDAYGIEGVAIGQIDLLVDENYSVSTSLVFKKTLSANVPDEIEAGLEEVHFTEKGEIFTYTNDGKKLQLGGSGGMNEMVLSSREW